MGRMAVELLKLLVVMVVSLVVAILGACVIQAFTLAGLPWVGAVIAVLMAVAVGTALGNMF